MKRSAGITFLILIISAGLLSAQSRKVSSVINQGSVHLTAPSISGDASTLVYLTNYTSSGDLEMMMSVNEGGWTEPITLPKSFNSPKLNYAFGHYLNFEGNRLYFTSRRSGSKGYDIWYVDRQGTNWGAPRRLPEIINTTQHEGAPSFTPDDSEIYFSRCTAMLNYNASGCNIYYSRKVDNQWTEPVALPDYINNGNVLAPRIQPDGKTLYFASNKAGGKGKFDLYMTRRDDEGNWSQPVAMDFANTVEDDLVSTVSLFGNLMMKGQMEGSFEQLYEILIPEEFKPGKFIYLKYDIERDYVATKATMILQDWESGEEIMRKPIDEGTHTIVINEGSNYHLMIQPAHLLRSMVSRVYDVHDLTRPLVIEEDYKVTELTPGRVLEIDGIARERRSPHFSGKSDLAFSHISKMLKNVPLDFEIELVQRNYMEDSLFTHEDLTEMRTDTLRTVRVDTVFLYGSMEDSTSIDTLISSLPDSMGIEDASEMEQQDSLELVLSIDSLGMITATVVDSVAKEEPSYELQEVEVIELVEVYHNDRFEAEAEELRKYLVQQGVPEEKILITRVFEDEEEGKPDRSLRIRVK